VLSESSSSSTVAEEGVGRFAVACGKIVVLSVLRNSAALADLEAGGGGGGGGGMDFDEATRDFLAGASSPSSSSIAEERFLDSKDSDSTTAAAAAEGTISGSRVELIFLRVSKGSENSTKVFKPDEVVVNATCFGFHSISTNSELAFISTKSTP
jgi:hypothetical protein